MVDLFCNTEQIGWTRSGTNNRTIAINSLVDSIVKYEKRIASHEYQQVKAVQRTVPESLGFGQ